MAPHTYSEILARNIRAARNRVDIGQESLASRMRALGFDAWIRQTVGSTERGRRRPAAEEILGLALALETSMAALMAASPDDRIVDLPSGETLSVNAIRQSAMGFNDGSVRWDGDSPVFVDTDLGQVGALGGPQLLEHVRKVREAEARTRAQVEVGQFSEGTELRLEQPVVAAIVTSAEGILITRRQDGDPPWGFVTGKSWTGESPEHTAVREVKEETGLDVRIGERIGERNPHPRTGKHLIYLAAKPVRGATKLIVGDEEELAEVRWASLDEALELLPDMFGPVRGYLARELES